MGSVKTPTSDRLPQLRPPAFNQPAVLDDPVERRLEILDQPNNAAPSGYLGDDRPVSTEDTPPNATDEQGRRTGLWEEADDHGGVMRGEYLDGERVGTWRHVSARGRLRSEGGYAGGQLHGRWTWWRTDGSKLQEGAFDHGDRTGLWRRWSAAGALLDEGEYQGETKVGTWVSYHPDGSVKATKAHRPPA